MSNTNQQSMQEFYTELMDQIDLAKDTETFGWTDEDFFTSVFLEYLEEAGEAEDPIICPYRDRGLQLNAFSFSEDNDAATVYVSLFIDAESVQAALRSAIDAMLHRAIQLYRRAVGDLHKVFERDSSTYEFASTVHKKREVIKKVHVVALTNGVVRPFQLPSTTLSNIEFSFSIWDVDRLYRCVTSGKMRETIHIDFQQSFDQ